MTIKPQTIMHLTITIIVAVWWFVVTDVSNYVWFGESVIDSDLSRIFWFKFIESECIIHGANKGGCLISRVYFDKLDKVINLD